MVNASSNAPGITCKICLKMDFILIEPRPDGFHSSKSKLGPQPAISRERA